MAPSVRTIKKGTILSEDIHHNCGVAAVCRLGKSAGGDVVAMLPQMLLDLQNRGQLAAGLTSYRPGRAQILDTWKDVGTVNEVRFTGGGFLLVIPDPREVGKEILIPAVEPILRSDEGLEGVLVIDPPEGLLDVQSG